MSRLEEIKSRYENPNLDFHCSSDHEVMIYFLTEKASAVSNMLITLHSIAKSILRAEYMLSTAEPCWKQSLVSLTAEGEAYIRNNASQYIDIVGKFCIFFAEIRIKYPDVFGSASLSSHA